MKEKGKFKGWNEILLNYSSIMLSVILTVYLFSGINAGSASWSFMEGMYALVVEFMAFGLINLIINDALRSMNKKYGGQCHKMIKINQGDN